MIEPEPKCTKEFHDAVEKAEKEGDIFNCKTYRVQLDSVLQSMKATHYHSRERSLAITKLQESIMWLGMELKTLGEQNPYPNSYKPENSVIDPTADGLKL